MTWRRSGSDDAPDNQAAQGAGVRIDKWLWSVRLFKTRSLAADACRAGHVQVNGQLAKPSRELRVGDRVRARAGTMIREVKVSAVLERRVGAKLVAQYLDELTPPEECRPAGEAYLERTSRRPKGTGRPTKRERRMLDQFFG